MARRGDRDGLLLDCHCTRRVAEGVVRSDGGRAGIGAVGQRRSDDSVRRVRSGAGRLGRQYRLRLKIPQREARRDDADRTCLPPGYRDVVGDHGIAVARRVGIACRVLDVRDRASCVRRAATTTIFVTAATAVVPRTATTTVRAGCTTNATRTCGCTGRAAMEACLATGTLCAATAAVVLRIGLHLRRAGGGDQCTTSSTGVAVRSAAVGTTCTTTATRYEHSICKCRAALAKIG